MTMDLGIVRPPAGSSGSSEPPPDFGEGAVDDMVIAMLAAHLDETPAKAIAYFLHFESSSKKAWRTMARAAMGHLAQKTADQECLHLAEITRLHAQLATFTAVTAPPKAEPEHNPFRDFPSDPRRIGG